MKEEKSCQNTQVRSWLIILYSLQHKSELNWGHSMSMKNVSLVDKMEQRRETNLWTWLRMGTFYGAPQFQYILSFNYQNINIFSFHLSPTF